MRFKCIKIREGKWGTEVQLEAIDTDNPRKFQAINKNLLKKHEVQMLKIGLPVYLPFIRKEDLLEKLKDNI